MSSIGGVCIDCGGPFTSIHNCPARNTAGAVYAPSVLSEVERLRAEIARLEGDRERLRSLLDDLQRAVYESDEIWEGSTKDGGAVPNPEWRPFPARSAILAALGVG